MKLSYLLTHIFFFTKYLNNIDVKYVTAYSLCILSKEFFKYNTNVLIHMFQHSTYACINKQNPSIGKRIRYQNYYNFGEINFSYSKNEKNYHFQYYK